MGGICFCSDSASGPRGPPPQRPDRDAPPEKVQHFHNENLGYRRFCHFGPLLKMSRYQTRQRNWGYVKKDWNSQLAEIGLKHHFELSSKLGETPGKFANKRYNEGSDDDEDEEDEDDDGEDALFFKPQDKIKIGFEFYKNMFFDPSRT